VAVRREAGLLVEVARFSPLPVPVPVFADAEAGVLAYPRLTGVPLNRLQAISPGSIAPALGAFLDAIHRAPLATMEALVEHDDYPHADWLRDAERDYRMFAGRLSPAQRAAVEAFLGSDPPPEPEALVFCHNDLGSEHVLVDPESGAGTGIIDWSDAAIADPARDFARLYRDLGPAALATMLAACDRPIDAAGRARIAFHARCALIEDIAYGLTGGESIYADAGLARLDRTFAPEPI
jgi:aminoglycoside phosphotransferase (APT) family kinase protein